MNKDNLASSIIKKLYIQNIILILMLVICNLVWILFINQYEVVSTTEEVIQETDDGGTNNYIGNDGDIIG